MAISDYEQTDAPDFSMFTEDELMGSDNDYLMREAEKETEARRYQQMVTYQSAVEVGLSQQEAELVAGVTQAEYAAWKKDGNYLRNAVQLESDTDYHNAVNIEGAQVGSLKKSIIGIFGLAKSDPKKYQGGKRTEAVQVTRGGKTFTQQRQVGSDKKTMPKKKGAGKEGEVKLHKDHPAEVKMKLLSKVAKLFGSLGKAIKEKAKAAYEAAKDPENIKKVADKAAENYKGAIEGEGTRVAQGDVADASQAGINAKKKKEAEDKRKQDMADKGNKDKKPTKKKKSLPKKKSKEEKPKKSMPKKKTEGNK